MERFEIGNAKEAVYIDLGANWANTLQLHKDLFPESEAKWSVFAFEANPMMFGYLKNYTDFLDNDTSAPPASVPPAGSTHHLVNCYAPLYNCLHYKKGEVLKKESRSCMTSSQTSSLEPAVKTIGLGHCMVYELEVDLCFYHDITIHAFVECKCITECLDIF